MSRSDPESEYKYLRAFQRFQRHKLEVYFLCSFGEKIIKKNIMEAYISSVINEKILQEDESKYYEEELGVRG